MIVKGITDEDFVNYKKPSMLIAFPKCSFKCDKECGRAVCQNSPLANSEDIDISVNEIIERYLSNPITSAICCAGLEPLDSLKDLLYLIGAIRYAYNCNDDIVIYTGYTKDEIEDLVVANIYPFMQGTFTGNIEIATLFKRFGNVIIKYGRYIPDQQPHHDEVLGVYLASDNQYAERL